MAVSMRADLFLGAATGLGLSALAWSLVAAPPSAGAAALLALALAAMVGTARVRLSRLGRVPASYPVVLATLLVFGAGFSCLAGILCTAAGQVGRPRARFGRARVSRLTFRLARVTLAAAVSAAVYQFAGGSVGTVPLRPEVLTLLTAHITVYLLVRHGLSRLWLAFTGRRLRLGAFLRSILGRLPGYVAGAALGHGAAWAFVHPEARLLLMGALVLWMATLLSRTRSDRAALVRRQRSRIESMQRSATRALARTVEARDETTRGHLHRVRRLCLDVGRTLNLGDRNLAALGTAALLHDIGKVAVPDGILSKPGRLSDAEMEQVKVHATVGAEILEGLPTPEPLVPIVRSHHERWDGRGYPDQLEGEAIPLGARILSAVDTYDALTSDRPYRQALSHDEAVSFLCRESGKMFDPQVVQALIDHFEDREPVIARPATPVAVDIAHDDDPAATRLDGGQLPLAQRELETFYDISRAMNYGLTLDEYLTLVGCQMAHLVPFQSLVVYLIEPEQHILRARFSMGKGASKLRLMTIPVGERLSGWAAQQQRAITGHDHLAPMERDGSRSDLEEWSHDPEVGSLKSTLAAPLVGDDGVIGVIALYDHGDHRFTPEERRIVVRMSGYVAQVAARSDSLVGPSQTSLTDPLTGVPNARFLWLETAHRIARNAEGDSGFGLLAFRVSGLEQVSERLGNAAADRALCQIARRFAANCEASETLVRFGQELFLVLTPSHRSGDLVERWDTLADRVEQPPLQSDSGIVHRVRLNAAHVCYPGDGDNLDALLEALDARLCLSAGRGRTIIPFRRARSTGTDPQA